MSRIFSISLLLAWIFPLFLSLAWIQRDISRLQKEAAARIVSQKEERVPVYLTFSKAETQSLLNWEHDREFEYQNQMYDILEIHERGDSISYLVWPDHEETHLKNLFSKLLKGGLEGEESETTLSQKFHFQLFWKLPENPKILPYSQYALDLFFYKTHFYLPPSLGSSTPPPDRYFFI